MIPQQDDMSDVLVARSMFVTVQRLGLLDRTTSFDEFVAWIGDLKWYAQVHKPK